MIMSFSWPRPTVSLNAEVDTLFLATSLEYAYLSSSTVKEVASYGGDVSKFVPPFVVDKIYNKIWSKKNTEVRREYRHEQQN